MVELFGVDLVDGLLVAGGYYAPVPVRARQLVDESGNRYACGRLRQGLHVVGGPGITALEFPVTLEAV